MATPLLRILNPQAPGDRQQAVAVPSKEARCYRDKGKAFPTPPVELLSEATAMAKAEKLLRAKGTRKPSRQQTWESWSCHLASMSTHPFTGWWKMTWATKSFCLISTKLKWKTHTGREMWGTGG
ncbi:hypothetical protein KUCAC02_026642 [Chaenocephalus aceratus]|nr:hypothetical protein KUCAC02_026642 [Chaenocephalus aceratus]